MSKLQVLMPMGGLGQRFRDVGIRTPKPLIPVRGVPMFSKALSSLDPFVGSISLTVVTQIEYQERYELGDKIIAAEPDATIAYIDRKTGGAVDTAMEAESLLNPDDPLIVMDCDIAFSSPDFFDMLGRVMDGRGADGMLLTFSSNDPRYSYVQVDASGFAVRTAEKEAISSSALMGAYFFSRAADFIEASRALLSKPLNQDRKEYYVSMVFNELIQAGRKIRVVKGDFYSFGTPEELERFSVTGMPI